jgi:hypothetical protein
MMSIGAAFAAFLSLASVCTHVGAGAGTVSHTGETSFRFTCAKAVQERTESQRDARKAAVVDPNTTVTFSDKEEKRETHTATARASANACDAVAVMLRCFREQVRAERKEADTTRAITEAARETYRRRARDFRAEAEKSTVPTFRESYLTLVEQSEAMGRVCERRILELTKRLSALENLDAFLTEAERVVRQAGALFQASARLRVTGGQPPQPTKE